MFVSPQVIELNQAKQNEYEVIPSGAAFKYEDVEAFLTASSVADIQRLIGKYSLPALSLYGSPEAFWDGDDRVFDIAPHDEGNLIDGYINLKSLMRASMILRGLLDRPNVNRQDIEELGIEISDAENGGYLLSLSIELINEFETIRFLNAGVDNARRTFYVCEISELSSTPGSIPLISLEITSRSVFTTPEYLRRACEDLFNSLTKIMLHDLTIRFKDKEVFLSSTSTASSLWCVMLERFQEGRVGVCPACDKAFVAVDERGKQRLYCNDACNKMHKRFLRYRRYIKEGCSDEEAAKKSHVAIDRARKYWEAHTDKEVDEQHV